MQSGRSAAADGAAGGSWEDGGEGLGEEDAEVQFGGGHVLEFYGLTPAVRTQHLEAFLAQHCLGHASPPIVR